MPTALYYGSPDDDRIADPGNKNEISKGVYLHGIGIRTAGFQTFQAVGNKIGTNAKPFAEGIMASAVETKETAAWRDACAEDLRCAVVYLNHNGKDGEAFKNEVYKALRTDAAGYRMESYELQMIESKYRQLEKEPDRKFLRMCKQPAEYLRSREKEVRHPPNPQIFISSFIRVTRHEVAIAGNTGTFAGIQKPAGKSGTRNTTEKNRSAGKDRICTTICRNTQKEF